MPPENLSSKIPHMTPESAWVLAADRLPSKEIIILCFGLPCENERLLRYLDLLRQRPELLAQTGACLICFELAKRRVSEYELEFLTLLPVVREWIASADETVEWLQGDTLLAQLWADLRDRLSSADPREAFLPPPVDQVEDAELEFALFEEEEIDDLGLDALAEESTDYKVLTDAWNDRVNTFLLADRPKCSKGFFAGHDGDLDRFEQFRLEAISFKDNVANASSMLPIVELFMAAHMRSRNFFGRKNKRRDQILVSGLSHMLESPRPPVQAVSWLQPPTGHPDAWPKIAEHLLHFLSFAAGYMHSNALLPHEMTDFDFEDCLQRFLNQAAGSEPEALLHEGWDRRRREMENEFDNAF